MAGAAKVWVVDDEDDVVHSVGALLNDAGYEFRGFTDPRVALEALDANGPPDLVLLDLNMPHMTGVEWLRALRGRADSQLVPVLVVTALSSESSTLNALEAGADDVLRKPVSVAELLARISGQLNRSGKLSALRQENLDLVLLTELAQALGEETALPDVLRTLIDGLRRALEIEAAAFYLLDSATGDLHRALPADPSRSEGSPKVRLDLRDLPEVADRLAARQPAILDAAETSALQVAIGGAERPYESSAVFPLLHRKQLLGVIVIAGSRPLIGALPRDRFFTSIITAFAAVAVNRAELFQSVRNEHATSTRTNAELEKTRDFLENVILSSPDAIVASNQDGEIMLYNEAAERILGWTAQEAIGADVRILYPAGGAERIMHMLRATAFGGTGRLEPKREIVIDREGREIPVEISAAIVTGEGAAEVATVGIFTDLRGRIRMEEQLQEATESLERSRRQAVVAELAGAAAHELNQPLTSLLGYAELLNKRIDEDDPNWRAVETIQQESKRIADIVKKIGQITEYRTKEYVGGMRIVDLDSASEVQDLSLDRKTETLDDQES